MRSKGNAPNAAQDRWITKVAGFGSVVSGDPMVRVHHCIGTTGKHNKVHIGHWWIIPLTEQEHDDIHKNFSAFAASVYFWSGETRKEVEKKLFAEMVDVIGMGEMPQEAYQAIMEYRR